MDYKRKLIEMYDKVGGIRASWIDIFKNVTVPYTENRRNSIIQDLDDMADWDYKITDVRKIVEFEQKILAKFEQKFVQLEKLIENFRSPKKITLLTNECEVLLEAIEMCYITLGKDYRSYGERLYNLTDMN